MQQFWNIVYNFFAIPLFWIAVHALALFKPKIRRAIRGRKELFTDLARLMAALPPGPRVWVHSSSMGEFEQAKPIIAALKQRLPDIRVIVSFFSPSGYEHSRKYPLADVITYIPFDSRRGAHRFLDLLRPTAAVMVRYDIWPNHIWELRRRRIPVIIANATMQRRTPRRLPLARSFHHYVYDAIDKILTVAASDAEVFKALRLTHPYLEAIGDTRYDQVAARSAEARKRSIIPATVLEGKKVIVAGSTWPEDEEELIPAFLQLRASMGNLLLVLVPHEPTLEHLEDLERQLQGRATTIRFSALNEYRGEDVVLVDSIGILLVLYAYAHIAFVGGSFRQGIHNILEAAVYGIPVLFGPRHRNAHEPILLVERGGGFVINNAVELHRTMANLLQDEMARTTAGARAAEFVKANLGATERILHHLIPYVTADASTQGGTS
jgi:3-deoxy-D-manno-octulosonic-acid transferase